MTREEVAQMISKALRRIGNPGFSPSWQMCRAGPGQRYKSCWSGTLCRGDGQGLNLSYDFLRTMVALDRLGALDRKE